MSHASRNLSIGAVALLAIAMSNTASGQAVANAPQVLNGAVAIQPTAPPGILAGQPATGATTPAYPDIADAMARADAAQQIYTQAQAAVRQMSLQIRKNYESAPETLHARAELDAAATNLNNLRAAVVVTLHADPAYAQLQIEIDHVAGALDPQASLDLADVDRAGLAEAKMQYAARLHHMEEDALNQSPDYTIALQRLDQASVHWTTIQAQIDAAIADDPQLKAAQAEAAGAQTNLSAAEAYLQGALLERHDAVRAEHLQDRYINNDLNGVNTGFDYNGYPFYGRYPPGPFYNPPVIVSTPQGK